MQNNKRKWWLVSVALLLLSPVILTAQHADKKKGCDVRDHDKKCRQVPDRSSSTIYLIAAGATCLGAMLVRSRLPKS